MHHEDPKEVAKRVLGRQRGWGIKPWQIVAIHVVVLFAWVIVQLIATFLG